MLTNAALQTRRALLTHILVKLILPKQAFEDLAGILQKLLRVDPDLFLVNLDFGHSAVLHWRVIRIAIFRAVADMVAGHFASVAHVAWGQ